MVPDFIFFFLPFWYFFLTPGTCSFFASFMFYSRNVLIAAYVSIIFDFVLIFNINIYT